MRANLFQFYFGTFIYNLVMKIPWKKLDWVRAKEEYCDVNRSFLPSQFPNPTPPLTLLHR